MRSEGMLVHVEGRIARFDEADTPILKKRTVCLDVAHTVHPRLSCLL